MTAHDRQEGPRYLVVGKVLRPRGIRGEVKVQVETDYPERFASLEQIYVGDMQNPEVFTVEEFRMHKGAALLKFEGYDTRDSVEHLRGQWVQVTFEDAIPLEEDEYYLFQIVGLEVVTAEGEHLGSVAEVLSTGSADVFVVRNGDREVLLPAIEDVVVEVDLEEERITVELMEGLA